MKYLLSTAVLIFLFDYLNAQVPSTPANVNIDFSLFEKQINELSRVNGGQITLRKGIYDVSKNTIVPSNIILIFEPGAVINLSKACIFTLLGKIDAGEYRIFTGLGKYSIHNNELNAAWFGILTLNAIDDPTIPNLLARQHNLSALQRAINTCSYSNEGTIKIPRGRIYIYGTLVVNPAVNDKPPNSHFGKNFILSGYGKWVSKIVQTHPTADLLSVVNQNGVEIRDLSLIGQGSLTAGDVVRLIGSSSWTIENVILGHSGGRALFNYRSERGLLRNSSLQFCRQAIVASSNECYYNDNLQFLDDGSTCDEFYYNKFSYDENTPDGSFEPGNSVVQNDHAILEFRQQQNTELKNASIKSQRFLAGMKVLSCENFTTSNTYFEGFKAPSPNPSIIIGGRFEKFTVSTAVNSNDNKITVIDAKWSAFIAKDTSEFKLFTTPVIYAIYSPTTPQNVEYIKSFGFIGNVLQVAERGSNYTCGNKAIKNPPMHFEKGVVVREIVVGRADVTIANEHLEGFAMLGSANLFEDYSKGKTNGQIICGYTYDEWANDINISKFGWTQTLFFYGKIWTRLYTPASSLIKIYRSVKVYNFSDLTNANFIPASPNDVLDYHSSTR